MNTFGVVIGIRVFANRRDVWMGCHLKELLCNYYMLYIIINNIVMYILY